jgi:hypothetical protein
MKTRLTETNHMRKLMGLPLLTEQHDDFLDKRVKLLVDDGYKIVDKIDLPDDTYTKGGGGYIVEIKDINGKDTGYAGITNSGIKDAYKGKFEIKGGKPHLDVYKIMFKDVGYKAPTNDPNKQKIVGNKVAKEGIKNISNNMINAKPFKGTLSSYYFGGIFQGVKYLWDLRGVSGFNEVSGKDLTGIIYTEKNNLLPKLGIDDGAENGAWVAFQNGSSFNKSTQWVLYNSTSGVKVKTPN